MNTHAFRLFSVFLLLLLMLTLVTACGGSEDTGDDVATTEQPTVQTETYELSFYADGTCIKTVTTNGAESITLPSDPEKAGYEFLGWYIDGDSEQPLTADTLLKAPVTSDLSVTALFAPIVYNVQFVADGVTVETATYTVEDLTVSVPDIPAKQHYSGAWESYELTMGDLTVEAVYTPVEYTVTFKADGETVATDTYTVEDTEITVPTVPAKSHYTAAWGSYELTGGNVDVEAVYTPVDYTVTFKAEGETVATRTYNMDNMSVEMPDVPAKNHYVGEWENMDGLLSGGDVTVNAVYTPADYKVTFYANGGYVGERYYTVENTNITAPDVPAINYYTGAWESYTLTGGNVDVNAVYTPVEYTVTFVSGTQKVGTATYTVEDTDIYVPNVPTKTYYTSAWEEYELTGGDVVVNAVYTPISYTVSFYANGTLVGTAKYTVEDDTVTEPAVPAKTHYTGEWGFYSLNYRDMTVEAVYTPVEYTVTFVNGDTTVGTDTYTVEDTEITEPAVPAKTHYTGAWEAYELNGGNVTVKPVYTPTTYSVTFIADGTAVAVKTYTVENMTVTAPAIPAKSGYSGAWQAYTVAGANLTVNAVYTPVAYTVTFDSNGGSAVSSVKVLNGGMIPVPAVPTRDGYVFAGWLLNGAAYDFTSFVSADVTLTASWSAVSDVLIFTYDETTQTYTVTGYTGSPDIIVIPATYEGKEVVGIADSAFKDCTTLKSVVLADGIASVGASAFSGCTSLASVTLPDSVTSIGASAFMQCDSLTKIVIPSGVASIGDSAFSGCDALTSVTLPNGLTTLGSYVFYECGLREITIPDSVTSMGESVLSRCYNLRSVVLPSGITSIPYAAFLHCYGLKEITIPEGVTQIGEYAFSACRSLTSVTIPSGVTSIGKSAFTGCESLTSVTLPSGVLSVGDSAFSNCSALTSVTLPSGLQYIGPSAFYYCGALASIEIPSSVTTIGNYAFYYCTALELIAFPNSVTSLGTHVLAGCTSLTSVTLPSNRTSIPDGAFYGCTALTEIEIPSGVTFISRYAFYNCKSLTEIAIPSGVTEIEIYAFSGCQSLTSITFPRSMSYVARSVVANCNSLTSISVESGNGTYHAAGNCLIKTATGTLVAGCNASVIPTDGSVTSIGDYAFDSCQKLTSLTIPEGITSIGYYAFNSCTAMESVSIPSTLTSIGNAAFEYCTSLESVSISDLSAWLAISFAAKTSSPLYFAGDLYLNGELVTSVTVPADIASTSTYALTGCTSIRSAVVEDGATAIGDSLFMNCVNLTKVTLSNSLTSIGSNSFYGCENLYSVTLGTSLTAIGTNAFENCYHLAEVRNLSTSLTVAKDTSNGYVGKYSIYILTDAETASNLVQTADGYLFCKSGDYVYLIGYVGNKTVLTLPADYEGGTYRIRDYAFYNRSDLTGVTLSEGVTWIGSYAFYGCTGIKSIVIPNSVTYIANQAFRGCTALESLTIGTGLRSFGSYAFADCKALEELNYNATDVGTLGVRNGVFGFAGQNGDGIRVTVGANVRNIPAYLFCPYDYSASYSGYPKVISLDFEEGSVCTHIVTSAFQGCRELMSVTIPNTSSFRIDDYAFSGCIKLSTVYNYHPYLKLEIGSSDKGGIALHAIEIITSEDGASRYVQTQDGFLFYENGDVCYLMGYNGDETDLTLPENCNGKSYEIYAGAFCGNTALTSVVIPEGVTAIGAEAFYGCTALKSVTFPSSLKFCGGSAFLNCSAVTELHISDMKAWIEIERENWSSTPLYYAKSLYLNGELVTELVIPDGITEIGDHAFYGCQSLTRVTVPSSVKRIGSSAFAQTGITEIILNEGLESIGRCAFSWTRLTELILPEGLLTLDDQAIYECTLLKKITVPSSVTDIGTLGRFYISSCISYNEYEGAYYFGNEENPYLILVSVQDKSAFSYTIHPDTKFIGAGAFYGCTNLTQITIPDGIISIEDEAFGGCTSLTTVVLPDSVETIGIYLFRRCTALKTVILPEGLKELPTHTFIACSSLEAVVLPNGLEKIEGGAFSGCSSLTTITIPVSVTEIGSSAFDGCSALTSVHIGDLAAWSTITFGDAMANPLYYTENLYLCGTLVTE